MSSFNHRMARPWQWALHEPLLLGLFAATLAISLLDPRSWSQTASWLDAPILASLTALLAVAQAIRCSGVVQKFAQALLRRMHTQRTVAGALMVLSGVLAMLLTNDVALFLIVPLTLVLAEMVELPRQRLVVFEALAVNAGSALSPIGNPQNLLLWQHSNLPMWDFVRQMAGPVLIMAGLLAGMVWWLFPRTSIALRKRNATQSNVDTRLAVVASLMLLCVLVLLETGHALAAAAGVLVIFGALRPSVLRSMDWVLIITIALLLLLLGHLAALPVIARVLDAPDWQQPSMVLLGGVLLSQLISNVPATIALLDRVPDTLLLAGAVNIGGAGLAVGSLANLIALRLEGSRRIWAVFHVYSIPYLLAVLALAWCLYPLMQ